MIVNNLSTIMGKKKNQNSNTSWVDRNFKKYANSVVLR